MKYAAVGIFVVAMMLLYSCQKADDGDGHMIEVLPELLESPAYLLADADRWYTYRVRFTSDEFETDSTVCYIEDEESGTPIASFTLFDDGGQQVLSEPDFASETSSDLIPNDNIFTRRINSQLFAEGVAGSYRFVFQAVGRKLVDGYVIGGVADIVVQFSNVEPCLITAIPQIQNFATCIDTTLEVRVARTEGDVVDSVRMRIETLEVPQIFGQQDFVAVSGDTVWQTNLTPRFFQCVGDGAYEIVYSAKTRFGMECEQVVMPVTYSNSLPVLSNSVMPDTILRPTTPGDTDTTTVTVNMQDCELDGEQFYYSLKFDVRREDTTGWTRSDSFFLRDDGVPPDALPGNGVYTVGLTFSHNTTVPPNIIYYFRFYAIECAAPNDTSEYLLDSVRVIQPGAIIQNSKFETRSSSQSGVDFGVWHDLRSAGVRPR